MALKLSGKDERLKRADFLAVSTIAGLRASDTHAAIDDVVERMRAAVAAITLPTLSGYGPSGELGGQGTAHDDGKRVEMSEDLIAEQVRRRRTFAIISHPDQSL